MLFRDIGELSAIGTPILAVSFESSLNIVVQIDEGRHEQ
jgi:hypothetical protein